MGEETTTTSAGPLARAPSSTALTMKLRWPRVLRAIPSFGVAYSQVRSTRYPSRRSRRRMAPRYSGGITPVGWFGMPVSTVTSSPPAAQAAARPDSRACGAPVSGGK